MQTFISQVIEGKKLELVIDTAIFPKDIILKAAYNFLDKGYFLFKKGSEDGSILLQLTSREDSTIDLQDVVENFSDELLDVYLRDKLERENKTIRETIITQAIAGPLDMGNFVSFDSSESNQQNNEIDFDKDIDDILAEIENDPDLQINEKQIEGVLQEIEKEVASRKTEKPKIQIDPSALADIKNNFKK